MTFILPPEAQDRIITVRIPKEVDPYFKAWYLDTKRVGESPEDFAYRNLGKAGIAYRRQKRTQDKFNAYEDDAKAEISESDALLLDAGI